jgi:aspartyl-tRNA(Asn)/glutamyl-tRNA(Gln) amidotransferase subunit C
MISTDDVKHVAKLARLELSEAEINKFSKQLGDILKYAEQMNEVDTTGVEPMAHPLPVVNVMREDRIEYEQTKEELMKNAPEEEDGFLKVPKIY